MSKTNRVVRLKQRPTGAVTAGDFAILEEPLAEPKDGEIRVRIAYVSLDPAMRGWIAEGPLPPAMSSCRAIPNSPSAMR